MGAGGANLGRIQSYNDMSAVAAFPNFYFASGKYLSRFHVMKQRAVTLLMMLFNGGYQTEFSGQLGEALLLGGLSKSLVHIRPFVILALAAWSRF